MLYRSKTQSFEEWLEKVNDVSGLITEFKVFDLLNGLVRTQIMEHSLHALKK